jgi:hypothetical protein
MLRVSPVETWRSTVAFWSEMALAPSRVAQAQARAGLRLMEAVSPWRLRNAAGTLRTVPGGEVRATVTVVTLPGVAERAPAPVTMPEVVNVAAEPVAAEVVKVVAPEPVAAEPEVAEVASPAEEHLPHRALAEASPLAVAVATAEEAMPVEALAAQAPEAPAPLAVLTGPAPETLETAALEPMLALAEGAKPATAKPQAKARTASPARKPRARRG